MHYTTNKICPPVTVAADPLCGRPLCLHRVILAADGAHPRPAILPVVLALLTPPPPPGTSPLPHTPPPLAALPAPPRTQTRAVGGRGGGRVRGKSPLPGAAEADLDLEALLYRLHAGHGGLVGPSNYSGVAWGEERRRE